MKEIVIAGLMPQENWFMSNRIVVDPKGISPTIMALPGGGSSNAKVKIIEYEGDTSSGENRVRKEDKEVL